MFIHLWWTRLALPRAVAAPAVHGMPLLTHTLVVRRSDF